MLKSPLKKLASCLLASGLLLSSATAALANSGGVFYLAPALQYISLYVGSNKYQGISPIITAGYGGMVNSVIYLAGEIFAIPATATINNNPNQNGSLRTSYGYGASLLPGYYFDDSVMGYARLGYIVARFENFHTTKAGYEVGAGVDIGWTANISFYGEYDFAKYRTLENVGAPKAGIYTLGLKYKFL